MKKHLQKTWIKPLDSDGLLLWCIFILFDVWLEGQSQWENIKMNESLTGLEWQESE